MRATRIFLAGILVSLLILTGCAHYRPPRGVHPIVKTLVTTGYCPCKKCCNWKRNWYGRPVIASGPNKGKPKKVGWTASGVKARPPKGKRPGTIAADTRRYPFGTIMYVPGYGWGRVEDRGGDIKGDHIDLFFKKHKQAMAWGRKRVRVKIWIPGRK